MDIKINLWLVFSSSVVIVLLGGYLLLLCRRVHAGVVSQKLRMHPLGHPCAIFLAYWLPLMMGFSQLLTWTAFSEGWSSEVLIVALFGPIFPIGVMYCLLRGTGYGDTLRMSGGEPLSTKTSRYRRGDTLKYHLLGGTKKPPETSHPCDIIVGPPVAGLEVMEVMYGGYLRLLYPRQLFQEAIPGGRSVVIGPFESITHSSVLTRDDHDMSVAGDGGGGEGPPGVASEFICSRHEPPASFNEANAMNLLLSPRPTLDTLGGAAPRSGTADESSLPTGSSGSVCSVHLDGVPELIAAAGGGGGGGGAVLDSPRSALRQVTATATSIASPRGEQQQQQQQQQRRGDDIGGVGGDPPPSPRRRGVSVVDVGSVQDVGGADADGASGGGVSPRSRGGGAAGLGGAGSMCISEDTAGARSRSGVAPGAPIPVPKMLVTTPSDMTVEAARKASPRGGGVSMPGAHLHRSGQRHTAVVVMPR